MYILIMISSSLDRSIKLSVLGIICHTRNYAAFRVLNGSVCGWVLAREDQSIVLLSSCVFYHGLSSIEDAHRGVP